MGVQSSNRRRKEKEKKGYIVRERQAQLTWVQR
jgi:hypothetical protein